MAARAYEEIPKTLSWDYEKNISAPADLWKFQPGLKSIQAPSAL